MRQIKTENGVVVIKSDIIRARHAFSTRVGGVSKSEHTRGLNLGRGRGDDDGTVIRNLELFAEATGINAGNIISVKQIHSAKIRYVTEENAGEGFFAPEGESCDGYVTDRKGIAPAVRIADCAPILLCAEEGGVPVLCAAVHAGWRGTAAGIAAGAVAELVKLGAKPQNIRAAIGPCIGKCCYQVREDFFDAVRNQRGTAYAEEFITADGENPGFFRADIAGMNVKILTGAGISRENIDLCDLCTCCISDKFYSHRRDGEKRGTQLAVISL